MVQYLRRVVKTVIYFCVLMGVCLLAIILMSKNTVQGDYSLLFKDKGFVRMLYFIGLIALVYPLLAYAKKRVYLNRPFTEDRKFITELLEGAKYVLVNEEGNKLYFRPTSKLYRFMRVYEGTITLQYNERELELEGMRKDTFRLARYIQRYAENA